MSRKKTRQQSVTEVPTIRPDAAGIDISPEVIYVAVDPQKDAPAVRHFGTVTAEWYRIANWLRGCGVRTVAMESTGVYGIPLFQVLEERGMEVFLVNARHYKNVPGRKTDVCDSAWLQYLHAVGLLQGSFRPAHQGCAFRTVLRHRGELVQAASKHIQHMQKALDQMNVQVHRVWSDLTGVSGLAILDAMLAGERDGHRLAALRDGRVQASEASIVAALEGDYWAEHLFTLQQSLESYRHYQKLIAECDRQLRDMLEQFEGKADEDQDPPAARKNMRKAEDEQLRQKFYRILGVDLTAIPSVNVRTVAILLGEVGPDLSRFPLSGSVRQLASVVSGQRDHGWENPVQPNAPGRQPPSWGIAHGRRIAMPRQIVLGAVLPADEGQAGGGPQAITAAAHKLARILYTLITRRVEYDESRFAKIEKQNEEKRRQRLTKQARAMEYILVPSKPSPAAIVS